jgi:hypothetical protein
MAIARSSTGSGVAKPNTMASLVEAFAKYRIETVAAQLK